MLLPLCFAAFPAAGRICGSKGRERRGEKAASKQRGALEVLESLLVSPGRSEEAQEKQQLGPERDGLEKTKTIGSLGRKGRKGG